jgi:transglutaminase-like putative cysteine protease
MPKSLNPLVKPLLIALVLFGLPVAAQYRPSFSSVREVTSIHVNKDGSSVTLMEAQRKIETQQGIEMLGEQRITYNSTLENVEVLEAYTLLADGTRVNVEPDKIRTQDDVDADGSNIYSDSKVKLIIFPKVEVGATVYFKSRAQQHTPDFPGHFYTENYFSPHSKYKGVTFNLTHDPAIAIGIDAQGMKGGKVEPLPTDPKGSVRYSFTFEQDTTYPTEDWRLDLVHFAPRFAASSFKTYAEVGRSYQERAYPKTQITPDIQALANQLTQYSKSDKDKVRKLYNWVAHNIRYVGIYLGAGGVVPHDAQSILTNRYGDCKDHVVLLEALLRAVGIESSPALINAQRTYILPKLATTGVFDHVITYVPSLDLFLDSTSRFAPMGTLPNSDMQKPVVITATGEVKHTPSEDPAKDFTTTTVRMQVKPDGSIAGKSSSTMHGYFQVSSRGIQFGNVNRDQETVVTRLLSRFQESGTGRVLKTEPMDLDRPWKVEAEFTLDPLVNIPGPSAMTIPVGVAPGRIKALAGGKAPKVRRYPTGCGSSRHVENIEIAFLPTMKIDRIPQDVKFALGPLRYTSTYTLNGNTLNVRREFVGNRKTVVCSDKDDRDWERFSGELKRDLRQQVFFQ